MSAYPSHPPPAPPSVVRPAGDRARVVVVHDSDEEAQPAVVVVKTEPSTRYGGGGDGEPLGVMGWVWFRWIFFVVEVVWCCFCYLGRFGAEFGCDAAYFEPFH